MIHKIVTSKLHLPDGLLSKYISNRKNEILIYSYYVQNNVNVKIKYQPTSCLSTSAVIYRFYHGFAQPQ